MCNTLTCIIRFEELIEFIDYLISRRIAKHKCIKLKGNRISCTKTTGS